jgi:xanthine dehydrogenase accessory factor
MGSTDRSSGHAVVLPLLPFLPIQPVLPPYNHRSMNREVFAAVADALERGEPAALVTIVATTGSTPQRVGAKMLVFGDGRIVGTIGGGCYENDAFGKAREAILSRAPQLVHYELDDDFAQETGLICGGQMDVYIEPIEPSPELFVIGAGHVGLHLARLAQEVGFRVHVVDDREKFANRERFPLAAEVIVEDIPAWIARTNLPPHAYAVIVTRGHTNDLEALRALAPRELRYLGLIGSRAKVSRIYEQLVEDRMSAEALKHVHAPIGLDIGAVTPQEIAVSILAELIAVKHGKMAGRDASELSMKWQPPKLSLRS